jgi:hypothetical protein
VWSDTAWVELSLDGQNSGGGGEDFATEEYVDNKFDFSQYLELT